MLSRFGIHELRPVNDDILRRINPQTMVLAFAPFNAHPPTQTDNLNKARNHILARKTLLPNTKLIVRWWHDDQRSTSGMSPDDFARDFFPLHIPGTLLMPDNEAAVGAQEYPRVVAWWTRLVGLATEAGVTLAIGCTSTGNPDYPLYSEIEPLLIAMREAARKGVVHWLYANTYYDPDDAGYRYHHLDRHEREFRNVANAAKLPMPPYTTGEFAIAWNYDPLAGFRRKMGHEDYANSLATEVGRLRFPVNGYSAGAGIFDTRWKDFNFDDMVFWEEIIPILPRVPLNANQLLEQAYMDAVDRTPAPTVPYAAGDTLLITPFADNVRLRPVATTAQKEIGVITGGIPFGATFLAQQPRAINETPASRVWLKLHLLADNREGWIATDAVKVIEKVAVVVSPPPPPPVEEQKHYIQLPEILTNAPDKARFVAQLEWNAAAPNLDPDVKAFLSAIATAAKNVPIKAA